MLGYQSQGALASTAIMIIDNLLTFMNDDYQISWQEFRPLQDEIMTS